MCGWWKAPAVQVTARSPPGFEFREETPKKGSKSEVLGNVSRASDRLKTGNSWASLRPVTAKFIRCSRGAPHGGPTPTLRTEHLCSARHHAVSLGIGIHVTVRPAETAWREDHEGKFHLWDWPCELDAN
jgi:hypothetical protein